MQIGPEADAEAEGARFFAILMPWGRVGSNMITAALASDGRVVIDNEPTTRLVTTGRQEGRSSDVIDRWQVEHLQAFHERHRHRSGMAIGLKLSHESLISPRDYLARLAGFDFRLIVMLRDNFLKCAVSQLRAVERLRAAAGQPAAWRSPWAVARTEPKPGPTRIDPVRAIRLARQFSEQQTALVQAVDDLAAGDVLRIEYRDMAAAPEATIQAVYGAIGLQPPARILVPHRKATSDVLAEDIVNYAEFAEAVSAAGLGHFLAPGV